MKTPDCFIFFSKNASKKAGPKNTKQIFKVKNDERTCLVSIFDIIILRFK